ncbi:hypothetical protein NFA_39590 [Nocardia farcinica IFM 10152]|uniref:Uncharacterized protein n=1 Tax=Nocardia farcinica (strain IFM 10152) TaxID=247156 RepID=Q5YSN4_NOCFA|nr:hypothetical protein NFA_39590 [Nocardia farcinica IFM 10152]
MNLKAVRRSIRGRIWVRRTGMPARGTWRHHMVPWLGCDEYYRRTLVIPVITWHVVIALRELPRLQDDPAFDPYLNDPIWVRWKQVRQYGRITR